MIRILDRDGREIPNAVISGTSADFAQLCAGMRRMSFDKNLDFLTFYETPRSIRLERVPTEDDDIANVLFSEEQINTRVIELANAINKDYKIRQVMLLVVANGGIHFARALMQHVLRLEATDVIKVKSYEGNRAGEVEIEADVNLSLEGKHVLIIDDIIDTGNTLATVVRRVYSKGAASVEVCVLLNKPSGRKNYAVNPRFVGFQVPDKFVVGFGMDFNDKYRNLPYIGELLPRVYKDAKPG